MVAEHHCSVGCSRLQLVKDGLYANNLFKTSGLHNFVHLHKFIVPSTAMWTLTVVL